VSADGNLCVFSRMDDVAAAAWRERHDNEDLFTTPQWLRSVESTYGQDRRYVVATDERPITTVVYRVLAGAYPFYDPVSLILDDPVSGQSITGQAAKALESLRCATSAVSTIPYGPGQTFTDGNSIDSRKRMLATISDAATDWGAEVQAVLYVPADDATSYSVLAQAGYVPFHGGANCVLDVPEDGLAGYLENLSSKRRHRRKSEIDAFRRNGLAIQPGDLGEHRMVLAEFAARLEQKYGTGSSVEHELRALDSIAEHLADECEVHLITKAGALAGFSLFYTHHARIYAKNIGFDRELVKSEDYAYFNTSYYHMLDVAADRGVSRLEYGLGSYQVKAERGCRPEPYLNWIHVPPDLVQIVRDVAANQRAAVQDLLAVFR
jgi:predicted N-acyltransferase